MKKHLSAARAMANECLCFRARRVSRALTRMYDEVLRPLGIHATQVTLLNAIALIGDREKEGATMGELAESLAMDGTTLSRNLRPLENDGLVRLTHSSTDRRMRLVRLTPRGERMVEEALPLWEKAHDRVIAALGPEAAADLRDQFDATVDAARETPSLQKT